MKTQKQKPLPYEARLIIAIQDCARHGEVINVHIAHSHRCPMGKGKPGPCKCTPDMYFVTPTGRVNIDNRQPRPRRQLQRTSPMKRPPLTLDQHRQLAALIRDPRIIRAACDIPNHCGLSSRVGKRARRIHSQLLALKSDLENHCASDHGKAHIGIYYGTESP